MKIMIFTAFFIFRVLVRLKWIYNICEKRLLGICEVNEIKKKTLDRKIRKTEWLGMGEMKKRGAIAFR